MYMFFRYGILFFLPLEWILILETGLHNLQHLVVIVLRSQKCTILNLSFDMLDAVLASLQVQKPF